MKLIIAGSRSFFPTLNPPPLINVRTLITNSVLAASFIGNLDNLFGNKITEIVNGEARGIDRCAASWAAIHNYPVKGFPANWERWGKAAGSMRNMQMAEYGDALVAIWDGKSRGTWDMVNKILVLGKPAHVVTVDPKTLY